MRQVVAIDEFLPIRHGQGSTELGPEMGVVERPVDFDEQARDAAKEEGSVKLTGQVTGEFARAGIPGSVGGEDVAVMQEQTLETGRHPVGGVFAGQEEGRCAVDHGR